MTKDNFESIKKGVNLFSLLKLMWPFVKRHLWLFGLSLVLILVMTSLGRALPFLFGRAIDEGIVKKDMEMIFFYAGIYVAIYAVYGITLYAYEIIFQRMGNRILFEVRSDLIRKTQSLPFEFFNKTPDGKIVTRLTNDVASLQELFSGGVIMAFVQVVILFSIVIAMLLISPVLTLITLVASPLFVWAAVWLSDQIKKTMRASKAKLSEMNGFTAENLNGIQLIQMYNRTQHHIDKYNSLSDQYRDISLQTTMYYALLWPTINFFGAFSMVLALYFGGLNFSSGGIEIGLLVAFFMHVQDLQNPLRDIIEKYQQVQNSITSAERVFSLMDQTSESDLETGKTALRFRGEIEFQDLYFRYPGTEQDVLKRIQLSIRPGERIGIVGKTGSGKTTLTALLLRLYDFDRGSIFIDGEPIQAFSKLSLRSRIGIVQQVSTTFKGTIFENISLGDPNLSRSAAELALDQIGFPKSKGLDYFVEEKGSNLSVGEKQLLAFARVLAFDKDILILDEATSSVDAQTEETIQRAIDEITKNRTSLIIAHRLSTLNICDRILVMKEGEIVEVGSHKELMARRGLFYNYIFEAQAEA